MYVNVYNNRSSAVFVLIFLFLLALSCTTLLTFVQLSAVDSCFVPLFYTPFDFDFFFPCFYSCTLSTATFLLALRTRDFKNLLRLEEAASLAMHVR